MKWIAANGQVWVVTIMNAPQMHAASKKIVQKDCATVH